jgi:hypothetical protein
MSLRGVGRRSELRVVFRLVLVFAFHADVMLRQNKQSQAHVSLHDAPSRCVCMQTDGHSMPGIARKVLIFAAVDGLVLQPAPPRNHKPATEQAIKVEYKTNAIAPLLRDRRREDTAASTLEAHGIVGTQLAGRTFSM